MSIVAIIPARIGSKRIPRKNLEKLGDKTLVEHALHAAAKCLDIDRIILYIDSLELAPKPFTKYDTMEDFASCPSGKRVFVIEDTPGTVRMKLDDNLCYLIKGLHTYDYVVLLQPTSPLRTTEDIRGALNQIVNEKTDSLFSAYKHRCLSWQVEFEPYRIEPDYFPDNRPMSQDLKTRWIENGAIYIFKPWVLLEKGARLGGLISVFEMPRIRSVDIDEPEDLELARAIYDYQNRKQKNR